MKRRLFASVFLLAPVLPGAAAPTPLPASATPPVVDAPRPDAVRRAPAARVRAPSAMQQVAAAARAATLEPQAQGYVNAVQVYPYAEGTAYRLYTAPGRVTDIALQAGETLVAVAAGDTVRWTVGDTTSGSGEGRRTHVLVKPFAAGLSTNLVITTDRRAYHLALVATSATAMAAVSWSYPQDQLLALRRATEPAPAVATGLSVENLDFNYAVTGDMPPWRPLRAFDDGRQTYIEFPATLATGEAPPLFLLGRKGEATLVNYRLSGRFYVVDRLFEIAELRLGHKKQAVVRVERVASRRRSAS